MDVNFGLCGCGCGFTTPVATKTDARRGYKKGEHVKYMPGHFARMQTKIAGGDAAPMLEPEKPLKVIFPYAGKFAVEVFGDKPPCLRAFIEPASNEITEERMVFLRTMPDEEVAFELDGRARAIEASTRRSFIELGLIGFEMRERGLWAKLDDPESHVPFHSWEAWVTSALNVSASSAFAAVAVIENTKGIPVEDLQQMTRRNATQFARLSTKVQPKMLDKAKEMSEADFVAEVQKKHPDQHVAKAPALMLTFQDANNRDVFDQVIETAEWAYEVTGREDAVANVLAFFLDGFCEREGYQRHSNREAFAMYKKRGGKA